MSFLADLAAGGVTGLISGIGKAALDIRTAITGKEPLTAEAQAELLLRAAEIQQSAMQLEAGITQGQLTINAAEAASPGTFKGGWRPAIGWVCAMGLFYNFVFRPIVPWLVQVGVGITGSNYQLPIMPILDLSELLPLIIGMLGMGTLRTFEKYSGVDGGPNKGGK